MFVFSPWTCRLPQNGHVVTTTDCYRRTRQFVTTGESLCTLPRHNLWSKKYLVLSLAVLPKMGVSLTVIDPADCDGLEEILKTKVC